MVGDNSLFLKVPCGRENEVVVTVFCCDEEGAETVLDTILVVNSDP